MSRVDSLFIYPITYLLIILLGAINGCSNPQPAVIKGTVVCTQNRNALMEGLQVIALIEGKELGSGFVNPKTGEYFITLPEKGMCNLSLKTPIKTLNLAVVLKAIPGELVIAPTIDVPDDALLKPVPPAQLPAVTQPASITPEETSPATPESTPTATKEGGTGGKSP